MSPSCPVVVLVSGSGSILQALIEATADPAYGVHIVGVGADRTGTLALHRAQQAGLATFVCAVQDHPDRATWDRSMAAHLADLLPPEAVTGHLPRLVVSAGFMKILGPSALRGVTVLNTHPALLPSFPGAHAVRDALEHGVAVTGCTLHVVDAGVDTGPIVAQRAVPVRPGDTEAALHSRIKVVERDLLVRTVHRLATGELPLPGRSPGDRTTSDRKATPA